MNKIIEGLKEALEVSTCQHDLELLGPDVKDPMRWDRKRCRRCGTIFYKFKTTQFPNGEQK